MYYVEPTDLFDLLGNTVKWKIINQNNNIYFNNYKNSPLQSNTHNINESKNKIGMQTQSTPHINCLKSKGYRPSWLWENVDESGKCYD